MFGGDFSESNSLFFNSSANVGASMKTTQFAQGKYLNCVFILQIAVQAGKIFSID